MSIHELVSLSRRYGADRDFVVAGGGNTSWKTADHLFIKGSGTSLESIEAEGFVRMERAALSAIWTKAYPAESAARESAVLVDLMAARVVGEEKKRPSVETLLHDILPGAFVVHTHPALVNGVTCSARGEEAAKELFGDECLWIPSTNPGYVLSRVVKDAFEAHQRRTGRAPAFILLQNHGIFVAADSVAGIDAIYDRVMGAIRTRIRRTPDFSRAERAYGSSAAVEAEFRALASEAHAGAAVVFLRNAEIARVTADQNAFAPLTSAYSPDHIVYAGAEFLWVDAGADAGAEQLTAASREAWREFVRTYGRGPKLAAVRGVGAFGVGANEKSAGLAVELFLDAVKIAVYVESFGGPRFMAADQIEFIVNWEVESYRSKISTAAAT
jgi:rhamnose utilization protein RhaD (predicted bifunctional aldolase and dehydrogenase)